MSAATSLPYRYPLSQPYTRVLHTPVAMGLTSPALHAICLAAGSYSTLCLSYIKAYPDLSSGKKLGEVETCAGYLNNSAVSVIHIAITLENELT